LRAAARRKEVVSEGFPPQAPHQKRMLLVLDSGRMLEGDGFIQCFDHSSVLHTLCLLSKTRSQKKSTRDCLKTWPESGLQVDTFSGYLTGAQSPQNNMITSV